MSQAHDLRELIIYWWYLEGLTLTSHSPLSESVCLLNASYFIHAGSLVGRLMAQILLEHRSPLKLALHMASHQSLCGVTEMVEGSCYAFCKWQLAHMSPHTVTFQPLDKKWHDNSDPTLNNIRFIQGYEVSSW
jgi:hypothetical protein